MRYLILTTLILIQSVWVMGQKKLTNELIWTGNTFASERFEQGPSMNDGLHYTLQKSSKKMGDYIVKYSYATGDSVGLIASSMSIFKNAAKGLMSRDKVHYSKAGYEKQADLFFEAFLKSYELYKSTK
jgi:hypothetical protein